LAEWAKTPPLEAAPTERFSVEELSGLNHLLKPAETGGLDEYGAIDITISEEILIRMADWLGFLDL
jgi:hypothetical protein